MSVVISFKRGYYRIIDDDEHVFVVIDDKELEVDEESERARRAIIQKLAERDLEEELEHGG